MSRRGIPLRVDTSRRFLSTGSTAAMLAAASDLHFVSHTAYVPAHSTSGDEQMRNRWCIAVLILFLATLALAQAAKPADEVWAIRAGTLLDGRSEERRVGKECRSR